MDVLFDRAFWADAYRATAGDDDNAKPFWDAKAPGFARKYRRSGYIDQLIALLDLAPGDSVFDMGAGAGTLSIPLAKLGHAVHAADFSPRMLEELARSAHEAGVQVGTFERAWQDDWSDIPRADVAVSSRSLITSDLEAALAKLEGKARKRVAVTTIAGESPMDDLRMLRALGRDVDENELRRNFVALVNYLFAWGRRPRIEYIAYPRRLHAQDAPSLLAAAEAMARPVDNAERAALRAHVERHAAPGPEGGVALDYEQNVVWGYLEWDVPQA